MRDPVESPSDITFVDQVNPIEYNETIENIDVLSLMLSPIGFDFIADATGMVYAGYYKDYTNASIYSACLIIPVGNPIVLKGICAGSLKLAKGADNIYKYVAKNAKSKAEISLILITETKTSRDLAHKIAQEVSQNRTLSALFNDQLAALLAKNPDKVTDLVKSLNKLDPENLIVLSDDLANNPNFAKTFFEKAGKKPELVDSWKVLHDAGRTGGANSASALTRNIEAIESLHKLRLNTNLSKFGITDEMLAAIRGTDSYSYTQLLDELEKVLDILPADKTTNLSQVIQTGTQRGLINNNAVNGIYDRRHSVLTLNTITENEAMFRAADKIEFEAVLETINGIPQSVPDIKITINNKVKIGEVYAGTAGAKSNLASQSLTYFQQIDDINDLRFFRRMNLADKPTAKSAVIDAWKKGGVLDDSRTLDLFKKYDDDVLNTGSNPAVDSFEDFLKDNDEWFDLIFNSKF